MMTQAMAAAVKGLCRGCRIGLANIVCVVASAYAGRSEERSRE